MPADHLTEEFRSIPDFPGYRISNYGRVQTCWASNGSKGYHQSDRWKDMKATVGSSGYPRVHISRQGKAYTEYLHLLVLRTFVGPRPPDAEGRHLDGNRLNSRLDNLAWGTYLENRDDMVRHGTQIRGSTVLNAKLTEDQVAEIRRLVASGLTHHQVANMFGVGRTCVTKIVRREQWKHVI